MSPRLQSLSIHLAALVLIAAGFFFLIGRSPDETALHTVEIPAANTPEQTAAANTAVETPLPPPPATSTPKQSSTTVKAVVKTSPAQAPTVQKQPDNQVVRIKNPYSFPPLSFESVNILTRAALVNILCTPRGGNGSLLPPISGSGVIIDPRGVILTNAHVAQYVLLAQSKRVDLQCAVRTGAPAAARWNAEILYLPPIWVEVHAHDITAKNPTGTGEHDYALLRIESTLDGTPLQSAFPFVPIDVREGIGFKGDQVLAVSYPAEFLAPGAQFTMYPASSITTIRELMTFVAQTVDLVSLGGIIEAQGGSSGGAVVNAWGRLVALISTTSEGATTADRDLRAVTLSYIDRDLAVQTQFDLATTLGGDVAAQALEFNTNVAPRLVDLYLAQIAK